MGLSWWLDWASGRDFTLTRLPSPSPAELRTDLEKKQTEVVRISTEARPVWSLLNLCCNAEGWPKEREMEESKGDNPLWISVYTEQNWCIKALKHTHTPILSPPLDYKLQILYTDI